jgi:hypothetical protein
LQSTISAWCPEAMARLSKAVAKTANSFIMLTMRSLWLERNVRVFENSHQSAAQVLDNVVEEWSSWVSCRRRGGPLRDID